MQENNLKVIAQGVPDLLNNNDGVATEERWHLYRDAAEDKRVVEAFDSLTATLAATIRHHEEYLAQVQKQFEAERKKMAAEILSCLRIS